MNTEQRRPGNGFWAAGRAWARALWWGLHGGQESQRAGVWQETGLVEPDGLGSCRSRLGLCFHPESTRTSRRV